MVLHVHRSERADRLVDELAEVLRARPPDALDVEVVAVPAKGIERWLAQRLSHVLGAGNGGADGVCANVRFPHPAALIDDVVAAASGIRPEDDPWDAGRMLWTLLEVIDECAVEDWCATLASHLGVGEPAAHHRRGRRLSAAQHLARLFDSYGAHRPQMLRDWAQGEDTDGAGGVLYDDLTWQAELWRRLRERVEAPSPAELLEPACGQLRAHPGLLDLPGRLSVFGPTRLSTAQLAVLAALAEGRDVHLWLPHPSAPLWDRVAPVAAIPTGVAGVRRADDPSAELPRNPLLASLGHDVRELQLQLAHCDVAVRDHHHPLEERPATLLGRLQQALMDDRYDPERADRPLLLPDDRSVAVHACHGAARQVEVLRDALVGLLAADPTLEPRDVLVMCPDIEDYAPLIAATFGLEDNDADDAGAHHPGHRLRVRLADRSLRQTNPLLATVATLLELADARVTASQVLDLASSPPVRRRFRFSDDDLERVQEWVADSGVRWGFDAAHRARFGLDSVAQNTWRAGLDRVLLGAAMAEDDLRWVGLALPLDDVDSSDIELAGRLAELLDRLSEVLDGMAGQRPLAEWLSMLAHALDALTAVPAAETWQSAQARHELAQVAADAGARAAGLQLSLADVHVLLAARLKGRPTRANFRTGNLTMCSMVPMRSVPHRVVCLLGLDDGRFPRNAGVDGDDVLARNPCLGERDPRSEDRQLLLDAVLAAREHLVILYTGADPRTNAPRPAAVPVGEILDAVDALVRTAQGRPARDQIVIHHPLQPFDARNFTSGALGTNGPFSFDEQALRGAVRAARPREQPAPFLSVPLPPDDDPDLELDDLLWFLEHPARAFLRQRLGVAMLRDTDELADALCVEMNPLEKWAVGDRMLKSRLTGTDARTCRQAEWRRGALPPGELGTRVVDAVLAQVEPLVAASADLRRDRGRVVDITVDLTGRRLTGTVGTVHGNVVLRVEYSRLAAKHRLRAWAQLLALSAAYPGTAWTAVTIGRGPRYTVLRSVLGPLDGERARQYLDELVALHAKGLCAPLPMAVKTSATYAAKRALGMSWDNARSSAEQDWSGTRFAGEQAEEPHQLVWGEEAGLPMLFVEPPGLDEQGVGWALDEPSRFGLLARRLWTPLLAAEELATA